MDPVVSSRAAARGRDHAVLSSVSRAAVVEALRTAGRPLGVADLAERVGLHANTVRWHLDQLDRSGLVERLVEAAGRPGRPRLLYALRAAADLAPGGADTSGEGYRLLADILAGYFSRTQPDPAAAAAEAGRAWGGYLVTKPPPFARIDTVEATRRVVDLLEGLGFSPEPDDDGRTIALRSCPFREVAQAHPDVACSVHLGLIQGALVELGMPGTAARLEPFGSPGGCRARIGPDQMQQKHSAGETDSAWQREGSTS